MLMQLASHFWRPDFSPTQVEALVSDYAEDLGGCTLGEIENAIRDYRLRPNVPGRLKQFPGSNDLLELVQANRKHRASLEKSGPKIDMSDRRPLMWWLQDRRLWKPHWREQDAPYGEKVRDHDGSYRDADRGAF